MAAFLQRTWLAIVCECYRPKTASSGDAPLWLRLALVECQDLGYRVSTVFT